jgi:tetratricopeptide (TPR) repeat protein
LINARIAQENWKNAAAQAGNLSELYLTMGDLAQALKYSQQSIELADRSGDAFWRMGSRTTLADALHQAGRASEAEAAFREAEAMQKARQPQFPSLYSLWGFRYCDLLLSQGQYQEVQSRASQTLEWAKQSGAGLLSIALEHLSLGRAYLQEATLTLALSLTGRRAKSPSPSQGEGRGEGEAATYLQRAVDGLRQAGQQDDLPRGLLARAELHRVMGDFKKSQNDLDEAFTIATRGGMRLFEADCHLEYARLYLAIASLRGAHPERSAAESKDRATKQSPIDATEIASHPSTPQRKEVAPLWTLAMTPIELKAQAREHLAKAKALIEQTGYHRRDGDVKEIEAMINAQ